MKSNKSFVKMLAQIGNQLSILRIKKGYSTIKEFAQSHDLPEVQYWRIEKGKANITLKTLTRILVIHKVTLQEFFCLIVPEVTANNK
jgi:transcriptional regulator with XRE-family HTH domain